MKKTNGVERPGSSEGQGGDLEKALWSGPPAESGNPSDCLTVAAHVASETGRVPVGAVHTPSKLESRPQLQQMEEAQLQHREANLTALAAIGPRRKRALEQPDSQVSLSKTGSRDFRRG